MNTARNTLERLSLDPEAQRLAEERETALLMHQHYLASAFEAGEARGEARAQKVTIRTLCRVLDITLEAAKTQKLEDLDPTQLSALIHTLETERRWPESF